MLCAHLPLEGGQPGAASTLVPPVSRHCDQVTAVIGELHARDDFCKQRREAILTQSQAVGAGKVAQASTFLNG